MLQNMKKQTIYRKSVYCHTITFKICLKNKKKQLLQNSNSVIHLVILVCSEEVHYPAHDESRLGMSSFDKKKILQK